MIERIGSAIVTIAAAVYVLFLPGLVATFALFGRRQVDVIERVALGLALSIALVPLVGFYLNLVGVKINRLDIFLEVLGITVASGVVAIIRRRQD